MSDHRERTNERGWGFARGVFSVGSAHPTWIGLTLLAALWGCNADSPKASPVPPVAMMATTPTTTPVVTATTGPAFDANGFPTDTDPRDTIPFLAGDELAGRLPGTPGLVRAGDFLAAELKRVGVAPLPGVDGYFQPFEMTESVTLSSSTKLELNGKPLKTKTDFDPMGVSTEGYFRGDVAFVGYGITRPDYDDYAGIDVKGKVVLAMLKEPTDDKRRSRFAGPKDQWSAAALFAVKAHQARAHGAVALLLVAPPSSGGGDIVNRYFGAPDAQPDSLPTMQITRRVANLILATANKPDLKAMQDAINSAVKPASTDLPDVGIDGNVSVKRTKASVRNVIGCVAGTGPHKDEWVVVGAHYDHLGHGELGNMVGGKVGSLWHGADDNASGTAAVLELADRMAHGPPPDRSVLFVFFTAEEEGLIGSAWFTGHPPIPLGKISSMLNLDMVGRLKNGDLQIGGGATAKEWDGIVAAAVHGSGLTTSTALPDENGRGGIGPSDHANFAMHRIPVLFLFTGLHADYHRPSDTADKINYDGIALIVPVAEKILATMETMPRPVYDGSADSAGMALVLGNDHKAGLGVLPGDVSSDPVGLSISDVSPGSAAAKAGLKPGDILTAVGAKSIGSLGDLSEALGKSRPGDSVVVKFVRDSKPLSVAATLDERK
jgi:hypothetical protein